MVWFERIKRPRTWADELKDSDYLDDGYAISRYGHTTESCLECDHQHDSDLES